MISIEVKLTGEEARILSLQLLETAEMACLTTIDEKGMPCTRGMENLRSLADFSSLKSFFRKARNDFLLLFATETSSAKMRHIRNNPATSAYYAKPSEFRGLMLSGKAEIMNDAEMKESIWQERWRPIYPGGTEDPEYSLLSLHPTKGIYYHWDHQTEFEIKRGGKV